MAPHSNLTPTELLDKKGRNYLSGRFNEFFRVNKGSIDFSKLVPDHICYRCDSHESYKVLFADLRKKAILRSIGEVNGREISIFELPFRFETDCGDIKLLELCDQKLDNSQIEGFEHIEFAVADKRDYWIIQGQFQKLYKDMVEKQSNERTTFEVKLATDMTFIVELEPIMETIARRERLAEKK
ncbi:MAG TPA: VOC family protein [Candidatus Paceibacterota bacterium]|nr:VOC family protein [Candidatus Paceibacterota bacterium]